MQRPLLRSRYLSIHLNDHLAGITVGMGLARRTANMLDSLRMRAVADTMAHRGDS